MSNELTEAGTNRKLVLLVEGVTVPAFKNSKRSILDTNTGLQRTLTPGKIKKRMKQVEDGILCALYSACLTEGDVTDSGLQKPRRIVLCERLKGLSDDNLERIPEFSFGVEYVEPGQEGVRIEIEKL